MPDGHKSLLLGWQIFDPVTKLDIMTFNSNPGGYLKMHWVVATSVNHILIGGSSSPQPPRIAMRKTYHQDREYCQLAEFLTFYVKNMKSQTIFIILLLLKRKKTLNNGTIKKQLSQKIEILTSKNIWKT